MRVTAVRSDDFRGVLPVPPLARSASGAIDFGESGRIVRHLVSGGVTTLIYGGNAFLYHVTLREYEDLIEWLSGLDDRLLVIPSAGPSYGRAMDQALILKQRHFPCVLMLPCGDPRDAGGLERGYREFADACQSRLLLYLKEESNLGSDTERGLDAVARLIGDGVAIGVKYAVVRRDPNQDPYLQSLLRRVDSRLVVSGMGERPAVAHLRDWNLPGFTTGSGVIAPRLSLELYSLCAARDWTAAERVRVTFLPLEDLRDAAGPARVLHAATELAGIASTGPIAPFVSPISGDQRERLRPVAAALLQAETALAAQATRA